jgi:PAS domain S-box-containing protein
MSMSINILTIFLQFLAAFLALRFIRTTGMKQVWPLIVIGIIPILMIEFIQLMHTLGTLPLHPFDDIVELMELLITAILTMALVLLQPYYVQQKRDAENNISAQQRLEVLLNSQTTYVIRRDLSGLYTYVNRKFQSTFGWLIGGGSFIGRSSLETIASHHHDRFREAVAECLRTPGTVVKVELDKPLQNGEFSTLLWEFICLTDGADTPEMIQCIGLDISDRIRTEHSLQESEERYRHLFETMNQGVIHYTASGTIASINPAAEKILGGTPGKYIGTQLEHRWPLSVTLNGTSVPFSLHPASVTIRTGMPTEEEVIGIPSNNNGGLRWVRISGMPMSERLIHSHRLFFIVFSDITDEIESARTIERSKQRFEEILNVSPIVTYIFSAPKGYAATYISHNIERMIGYTAEMFIELPTFWMDHIHPDDRDGVMEGLKNLSHIREHSHEYRFRSAEGSYRWIRDDFVVMRDQNGMIIELIGAWSDITESVAAAEDLTRERKFLDAIINTAPVAFAVMDRQDKVVRINSAFTSIFGFSADEAVGCPINQLVVPDTVTDDAVLCSTNGLNETDFSLETIRRRKDGTLLNVEIHSAAFRFSEDIISFAMYRDITDRVRADKMLQENKELLSRAFDEAPFGMAMISLEGRYVKVNQALSTMTGRSEEDLLGLSYRDITHPDDIAFGDRCMEELRTREVLKHEFQKRYIHKDGSTVFVNLNASTAKDSDGAPMYYIVQMENITLKRQFAEIERRSQRRESLGTMASGIAHEMNNILSPILTGTSLLKYKYDQPELRAFIETMEKSATRGSQIIRQILAYSRKAEGDSIVLYPLPVFEEFADLIHRTFPRNIHITLDVQPSSWRININPTLLNQVLLNIAVNARDAMPAGGMMEISVGNITIDEQYARQSPDAVPGRYLQCSIKDNGVGMTKEVMQRIFDPFYTTKGFGKGTGLGLFSSISIIKNLGGFLRLESEPGKGTTVKFLIPAYDSELSGSSEPGLISLADLRGNGEVIFVVDDDESVRSITISTLRSAGYEVHAAADGTEALAHFGKKGKDFDLILSDIAMPVLDGVSTIRTIRHMNPDINVVMMTGLKTRENEVELKGMGITRFLDKPFTAETLLTVIADALLHPPVSRRMVTPPVV